MFIMDYGDPRRCFAGRVSARVLNQEDLRRAIKADEMFSKHLRYSDDYERNLLRALENSQDPNELTADVRVE